MKIDELISNVASEPERIVTRKVMVPPLAMLAKARKPGGMMLGDFLAASGGQAEQRETRYRHILGGPAAPALLNGWASKRPLHPLPPDLRDLVSRINGIHLWANAESGRSYEGLAPIEEWELARIKMYGEDADHDLLDDRYVALSYHQDGGAFVVLDVESGKYFLMDTAGPDTTSPIADNASELLDWLWRSRIEPKA